TDVAMISAAAMGTLLLVARIGDGIAVLVTGAIIQKNQLKWGKFRSWLLIAPPITAIFFTLMFTNFNLDPVMKAVVMCISYIIAHTFVNFAYNAHLALMGVIGKTPEERLKLSNKKSQFLCLSTIVFGLAFVPVLTGFAGGNYNIAVALFAVLQVFGYWNIFRATKEIDKFDPDMNVMAEAAGTKLSGADMFASIFKNNQLLLIMAADVLKWLGFISILGLIAYYFIYVAGDMSLIGTYFLWHGIASFAGSLLAVKIVKAIGKKYTVILSSTMIAVMYVLIKLFAGTNPMAFIALACIGVLGFQFSTNIEPAMYIDCAEYGFNKSGKDGAAFIMSMYSMPIKIGVALSGAAIGWGLAAIKYSPTVQITPEFTSNLTSLVTLFPAVCIGLSAVLMFGYQLTDKKVNTIMEENAIKRAQIQKVA
ncbi:MAG: MFS transporter, partial [Anaerolineaceae bacterium]|nr:MFS transporter [Anaerolineaceae bacterium]